MFPRFRLHGRALSRQRFEQQVLASLPDLYRTARALVGQRADAEDLVHDACLKAFAAFEDVSLDSAAGCHAWLRQILVNAFRDRYRRERRSPVRPQGTVPGDVGDGVIELAVSAEPLPEEQVARAGFEQALDLVLASLPPEVRTVAVLHIVSGVSYKDIARITDCPIGTVMSRLARARKVLRERLRCHVDGDTADLIAPGAGS